uniref:Uncharacterized protein n=1 Tax=Rhizophagus irregularis (strain DAOM 181602 / DAOM 197198 / MUCL 43194) TaxID=747089 RepID=U9V638_RHIID
MSMMSVKTCPSILRKSINLTKGPNSLATNFMPFIRALCASLETCFATRITQYQKTSYSGVQ